MSQLGHYTQRIVQDLVVRGESGCAITEFCPMEKARGRLFRAAKHAGLRVTTHTTKVRGMPVVIARVVK